MGGLIVIAGIVSIFVHEDANDDGEFDCLHMEST
jgi:hypothetical protein